MNRVRSLWGLRLLALALATLTWFFVALEKREGLSVRVIEASVRYDRPRDFAILDPLEKVRVTVQAPDSKMRILNPFNVEVFVRPEVAQKGTTEIFLTPEHVRLPTDGVEVIGFEPSVISLKLDRVSTQLLPVEPRLEGEPAAGALVREPEVDPGLVLVRGPESRIARMGRVTTTPIDLTGHALDFEEQAAVVTSDPMVQVLQPAVVTVRIPLEIPGAGGAEQGFR